MSSSESLSQQTDSNEQCCPNCNSTIPVHIGFVTWCDHCNWNVQPQKPAPPRTRLEAFRLRLGQRFSRQLFEQMMQEESLKPRLTLSKLLAFGLSAIVHSITFCLFAFAAWLIVAYWFKPLMVVGFLALGIAYLMRPRITPLPDDILPREQAPTLYLLVDRIAEQLHAAPVTGLVLDGQYNASMGRYGWRHRQYVHLGLPLLTVLTREEQVALIGHEIAHGVNGDNYRGIFVGSATRALFEWFSLLHPGRILRNNDGFPALALLMIPINILQLGFAYVVLGIAYLLSYLLYRDSQRAEYLADPLSAQVSGPDAMLSMLEKSHYEEMQEITKQRVFAQKRPANFFAELKQQVALIPTRERERIHRVGRLEQSRLDATHPPTAYRIDFLKSQPATLTSTVLLQPAEWERLEQELAALEPQVQVKIQDDYLARLYYRYL